MHCTCKKGYYNLVDWLVEKRFANVDLVDYNGNSALRLAAYGGYSTSVSYLLCHGCDSTLRNRWGTTAEDQDLRHGERITNIFKRICERDMFEMA